MRWSTFCYLWDGLAPGYTHTMSSQYTSGICPASSALRTARILFSICT